MSITYSGFAYKVKAPPPQNTNYPTGVQNTNNPGARKNKILIPGQVLGVWRYYPANFSKIFATTYITCNQVTATENANSDDYVYHFTGQADFYQNSATYDRYVCWDVGTKIDGVNYTELDMCDVIYTSATYGQISIEFERRYVGAKNLVWSINFHAAEPTTMQDRSTWFQIEKIYKPQACMVSDSQGTLYTATPAFT